MGRVHEVAWHQTCRGSTHQVSRKHEVQSTPAACLLHGTEPMKSHGIKRGVALLTRAKNTEVHCTRALYTNRRRPCRASALVSVSAMHMHARPRSQRFHPHACTISDGTSTRTHRTISARTSTCMHGLKCACACTLNSKHASIPYTYTYTHITHTHACTQTV